MREYKFDDVVKKDHPWTTDLRLPLVNDWHDALNPYPLVLVIPSDEREMNLWRADYIIDPTDAEAELLSAYKEFRIARWDFYDHYLRQMRAGILDVDPGVNTYTFGKDAAYGWRYQVMTWEHGPVPFPFEANPTVYLDLIDLIDRIENGAFKDSRYDGWKLEQADLIKRASNV